MPQKEGRINASEDPTIDKSYTSVSSIPGNVTTDAGKIGEWIMEGSGGNFGTYQSGHRIAEALRVTETKASVLIADEAHRTSGIRRKIRRTGPTHADVDYERKLRDFTICHDSELFPVKYRIYQTATPKIYDVKKKISESEWIVRSMDDMSVFGVELYRMSFVKAVQNKWLADYRIIALAVNSDETMRTATQLAREAVSTGGSSLSTPDYIRGLAFTLAIAGVINSSDGEIGDVSIKSCIAFMNTVAKSKKMSKDLCSETVRRWLTSYAEENSMPPPSFVSQSLITNRSDSLFNAPNFTRQPLANREMPKISKAFKVGLSPAARRTTGLLS